MYAAFNEAVQHARNGYTFSDGPIEIIESSGWCWFTMVQGSPNDFAIQAAKASVERSLAEEAAQYKKDVEAAAKAIFEEAKRAELERDVAAATAALDEQIAKLKRDAAVQLAQLQDAAAIELARLK